jgi:hypothetical protein
MHGGLFVRRRVKTQTSIFTAPRVQNLSTPQQMLHIASQYNLQHCRSMNPG